MSEWQPIATAPRDETDVLLAGTLYGRYRPPIVAGWFDKFTDDPGWYTHDDPDSEVNMVPTHWMPLPALPTPEALSAVSDPVEPQ